MHKKITPLTIIIATYTLSIYLTHILTHVYMVFYVCVWIYLPMYFYIRIRIYSKFQLQQNTDLRCTKISLMIVAWMHEMSENTN